MSKQYTKEETIKKYNTALKDPAYLYKNKICNWGGKTKTGEFYTEIIADLILKDIEGSIGKIEPIIRESSYNANHDGLHNNPTSKREEDILAIKLFKIKYESPLIGKVIDYQVPLKDKQSDKAGKIDLLSETRDGTLMIIELKKCNKDTLLHSALEIDTYSRIVDTKKLYSDYGKTIKSKLYKAIVADKGGNQDKEFHDHPKVKELLNRLNIKFYLFEKDTEIEGVNDI